MRSRNLILFTVSIIVLTSIVVYSADAAGIPKKAISTVSRFLESDLPTTTLFTDVVNTISANHQFGSSNLLVENPSKTNAYTITGGAISANRTLNLPITTGTDTLATLGLSQTFTGNPVTINNLALGGQANLGGNTLQSSGHVYTFPSNTGTILMTNGSGSSLSGVVASITGTANNITASSSTGAVTLNLGSNVVTTGGSTQTFTSIKNFSAGIDVTGLNLKRIYKTADYTATSTDDIIVMDTSGGTRTLTLPSASANVGKYFAVKMVGLSAGNVVKVSAPTDKIDANFGNFNMTGDNEMAILFSNGTTWHRIGGSDVSLKDFNIRGSTTRWYGAAVNQLATSTLISTVTTLRAEPWVVTHTIQIDKIQVEISTAANPTSTNCRLGIYRDNGNAYPQSLVTNSDAGTIITTAAVQTLTFSSPITLDKGLYWQAWSCGTAATTQPTFRAWGIGAEPTVLGYVNTMGANNAGSFYTVAFTFAAMPATFPAGATITANSAVPEILVEVIKG